MVFGKCRQKYVRIAKTGINFQRLPTEKPPVSKRLFILKISF
jgi:hypothetical protein